MLIYNLVIPHQARIYISILLSTEDEESLSLDWLEVLG